MTEKLLTIFDFDPTDEEWNALFPGISRKEIEGYYKEFKYTQSELYKNIIELLFYRGLEREAKAYLKFLPENELNKEFEKLLFYPDMINLK